MPVQSGTDRHQIQLFALEQSIGAENPVRVIDVLVDALDLEQLGFELKGKSVAGRPAFAASCLLKLYLYGYQNRIRSSRQLEKACQRNIELWWLLNYQQPCYKTIANFRKDNTKALKGVFRQLNLWLKDWGLFGGELVAVDGSKFRAQNSKKRNYNADKIARQIAYIDKKLDEYFVLADQLDEQEGQEVALELPSLEQIDEEIDTLMDRRLEYEQLSAKLEQSGERQISTTDADARALPLRRDIVEVSYNVQTATDAQHSLMVEYEVSNEKDDYALPGIGKQAKEVLGVEQLEVLADKGYHTGLALQEAAQEGLVTYVSPKKPSHQGKAKAYQKHQFVYDPTHDTYQCPQGQIMHTNGRWYSRNIGKGRKSYRIKRYQLKYEVCNACPVKDDCVSQGALKQHHGRAIQRSEYEDYVVANADRVKANKEKYRRRQAIVEHPFGTIKRQWGYDHTLLKGKEKVSADFALIFTAYNLRRAMSILGIKELLKCLKGIFYLFLGLSGIMVAHTTKNTTSCQQALWRRVAA